MMDETEPVVVWLEPPSIHQDWHKQTSQWRQSHLLAFLLPETICRYIVYQLDTNYNNMSLSYKPSKKENKCNILSQQQLIMLFCTQSQADSLSKEHLNTKQLKT